jgi:hypothetical protein
VVQTQLGHELQTLHPVFPEGEDRVGFEELVDKFDEAVGTISAEVNVEGVVNRVFLGEYIVPDIVNVSSFTSMFIYSTFVLHRCKQCFPLHTFSSRHPKCCFKRI